MLSKEQLRVLAPSVFDVGPVDTVSEKYSFVSTNNLIDVFSSVGWQCEKAKQVKSKLAHRKHHLTFTNPAMATFKDPRDLGMDGGNFTLELFNSSDGKFAFRLYLGIFTFICENGLVLGSSFYSCRIPHLGISEEDIKNTVLNLTSGIEHLQPLVTEMSQTTMNNDDAERFASIAYKLRYPKADVINIDIHKNLLKPNREKDKGSDLWTRYNVVQENLMRGGFRNQRNRAVRAINSIAQTERINTELWKLAEDYMD